MPNEVEQYDGDLHVIGNLEVDGSINDSDLAAILAAGQTTHAIAEVVTANIADMASDNKLTPVEKLIVQREWDIIAGEYADVKARGAVWGIASGAAYDAYVAAYEALDAWLNSDPDPLASLTTTTVIVGSEMRTVFSNYFGTKQAFLDAIENSASTGITDNTTLVTAAQAAADNALAIADGIIQGFFQDAAPSAEGESFGDFWIDTNFADPLTEASTGAIYRYQDASAGSAGDLSWVNTPTSAMGKAYLYIAVQETAADTAQGAADAAQADATSAQGELDDIADDAKITPVEKLTIKPIWDEIVVEGAAGTGTIPVQATLFSVADTDFDTAYAALDLYLNTAVTVFGNMATTTDITRATWDTAWKNYYDERTQLLNAIAVAAKDLADGAQSTADGKITTFYQDAAPTAEGTGDFWVDTDDNDRVYRWSGSAWVEITSSIVPVDPGTEDLVLYMPLDERAGTRVTDASGQGNHGTLTAGVGAWEDGHVFNAYHFDGAVSTIKTPAAISSQTFAISFLAKADSASQAIYANIIENKHSGTTSWACQAPASSNVFQFRIQNAVDDVRFEFTLSLTQFDHIVFVFDAPNGYLYQNGILIVTDTLGGDGDIDYNGDEYITIGSWSGADRRFDGLIDEVRIYDKALTPENVLYLYRNPGGTPKGLVTRNDVAVGELNALHLAYGGYNSLITNTELFYEDMGELFPLDFTCLSDLGRVPEEKLVVYEPAILRDEDETEYHNPRARVWDGLEDDPRTDTIGVWEETENVVEDPEDLTTANWTGSGSTAVLTDEYFNRKQWTKVPNDSAALGYQQQEIDYSAFSNTAPPLTILIQRGSGTGDEARVILYDDDDTANMILFDVQWATEDVDVTTGTLIQEEWISASIVRVTILTATLTIAHTHYLRCYASDDATADEYNYYTAVQVEDKDFPTPYTPTSRLAGALQYRKALADEGAIECWAHLRSRYNDSVILWEWRKDATHYFQLIYQSSAWQVSYNNGSGSTTMVSTTTYASDAALWTSGPASDGWNHIKVVWDFSASTGKLILNSVTEDSSWDAAVTAYDDSFKELSIGNRAGTFCFNGEITDFAYHDTEDDTSTHYTADAPWRGPYSVPNYDQTAVFSRKFFKLIRSELAMVDKKHRTIDIGSQGILARDRGGTIIHDIPDGAILADMIYGGHVVWLDGGATFISSIVDGETTANAASTGTIAANNVDISAYLPTGLTNVKSIIGVMYLSAEIDQLKSLPGTKMLIKAFFGTEYNVTPSSANVLAGCGMTVQVANIDQQIIQWSQVKIPIVFNAGVPYINWDTRRIFSFMDTNTSWCTTAVSLYLQGFLV